jgi:hypothetical protein
MANHETPICAGRDFQTRSLRVKHGSRMARITFASTRAFCRDGASDSLPLSTLDAASRRLGEDARVLEEERKLVKYIEGEVIVSSGLLDELRVSYSQLRSTYETNVGAGGLRPTPHPSRLMTILGSAQDFAAIKVVALDP